jgi:acetyl esterase/lipase
MSRAPARFMLWLFAFVPAVCFCANPAVWQPSSGHTQSPIWPGAVPDARKLDKPEFVGNAEKLVGGRPWVYVTNVSIPTVTVYPAKGKNSGSAVVVFPGGGYEVLAIDLEGTEVCEWFTSRGITCAVLKYRVPCAKVGPYRDCPTALQDAQRAIRFVRFHSEQWHVDKRKIGVIGFSAGGHLVAEVSNRFHEKLYPPVDAADKESSRPDFAMSLYPGHLAVPERAFALNPKIRVTRETTTTFMLQAEDDPVDPVENSLVYYAALRKAGVPAEMHVYMKGGHAFGMRRTAVAITRWPDLLETWLRTIGILSP